MHQSGIDQQINQPNFGQLNLSALNAAAYPGSADAMLHAEPKKQGKEKKPDENRVGRVFPGA